jgi:DNA-binding beta-propeller fold protein YncE
VSDHRGNIWVANCGNDSVTKIPKGDPKRAINIPLGPTPPDGNPQIKLFGAVIDADGNMWTANNRGNTVSIVSPEGVLIDTLQGTFQGKTVLSSRTLDGRLDYRPAETDTLVVIVGDNGSYFSTVRLPFDRRGARGPSIRPTSGCR